MNIGSLYKVKEYFWFLFPTKEISTAARPSAAGFGPAVVAAGVGVAAGAARHPAAAAWYSTLFNCEVTYFSPDSYIIFLEEDWLFKKVLTSDGRIGWTWFIESYNDYFEEVKTEE